jgi:predicted nucleic acid-binding protein
LPNVHIITTYYHWQLISADPDDKKYCDCAIAAQADFVVTEDKHFDILQTISFPQLQAISIDKFSAQL